MDEPGRDPSVWEIPPHQLAPTKRLWWIVYPFCHYKVYMLAATMVITIISAPWGHVGDISSLGVFLSGRCQDDNNQTIISSTEIKKVAAAAATTLMTLLPALLVFAQFPTARISTMIAYCPTAAMIKCGFTLGLPTTNISSLARCRTSRVKDWCTAATISLYSAKNAPGSDLRQLYLPDGICPDQIIDSNMTPKLLRSMLHSATPDLVLNDLQELMFRVLENNQAHRIRISVMKVGFSIMQTGLFISLGIFAQSLTEFKIVWVCPGYSNMVMYYWLFGKAISAGIIRTFAESAIMSGQEILYFSPLTVSARRLGGCEDCKLAITPPPCRASGLFDRATWYFRNLFTRSRPSNYRTLSEPPTDVWPLMRHLLAFQQTRHDLLVILKHGNNVGTDQLKTQNIIFEVLRGYFQALMLIFLTCRFGSTYDGDILQTVVFVVLTITITVISRTYSIYFGSWMESALGVTLIEYDTAAKLQAIKTILAAMPLVLVNNTTIGYTHAAGYRIDQNDDCLNHTPSITRHSPRLIRGIALLLFRLLASSLALWLLSFGHVISPMFCIFFMTVVSDVDFRNRHPIDPHEAQAATV